MKKTRLILLIILSLSAFTIISAPAQLQHCVAPLVGPEKFVIATNSEEDSTGFVDYDRDIKDLGTNIVVKSFFTTKERLYNFLKLSYTTIDNGLIKYKNDHNLPDSAVFLIFKGGNVLRMVANKIFHMLHPQTRDFLKARYEEYFKRSDADFSVYVDERKLGGADYEKTLAEVTEVVRNQLNIIRSEFTTNGGKYFDFLRLKYSAGNKELAKYMKALKDLPATKDPNNPDWYGAKFLQAAIGQYKAAPGPNCPAYGQYDYLYKEQEGNKDDIEATRLSAKPHIFYVSDNRTLEWPIGLPGKIAKFNLGRIKLAIVYTMDKDGQIIATIKGGEGIDASIVHRSDDHTQHVLADVNDFIVDYVMALDPHEQFIMKAYSYQALVEDLEHILFSSFTRPWNSLGAKYEKRIYRLFFLLNGEMMANLLPDEASAYLNDIDEKIMKPLASLFPLSDRPSAVVDDLKDNVATLNADWPNLSITNGFYGKIVELVERMIRAPEQTDQNSFSQFLDYINKNIDISKILPITKYNKINLDNVKQSNIDFIF